MGARAVNSTPSAETGGHCCAIIKGQGQDENTLGAKQETRRLHLDWKGLCLTTARFFPKNGEKMDVLNCKGEGLEFVYWTKVREKWRWYWQHLVSVN